MYLYVKVNAEKVAVSGKKRTQKLYRRHSGRPGGMKVETFNQLQQRIPERIIEHAVRGMLPKGRVSSQVMHVLSSYLWLTRGICGQCFWFHVDPSERVKYSLCHFFRQLFMLLIYHQLLHIHSLSNFLIL